MCGASARDSSWHILGWGRGLGWAQSRARGTAVPAKIPRDKPGGGRPSPLPSTLQARLFWGGIAALFGFSGGFFRFLMGAAPCGARGGGSSAARGWGCLPPPGPRKSRLSQGKILLDQQRVTAPAVAARDLPSSKNSLQKISLKRPFCGTTAPFRALWQRLALEK